MSTIIPIILCGGFGNRLWPMSLRENPKQFLPIFNKKSLFEMTLERAGQISNSNPIIITSLRNKDIIRSILKKTNFTPRILFEEIGRNTAGAICLSLIDSLKLYNDPKVIIFSSDHFINDDKNFLKSIKDSIFYSDNFNWTLFGSKPDYPSTGYGYSGVFRKNNLFEVESFIEKPNLKKAKEYCIKDNYFWNSGIFLGKSKKMLDTIRSHNPQILKSSLIAYKKSLKYKNELIFKKKFLKDIEKVSIDYAILEKEKNIGFQTLDCGWSDVGSWDTLTEILDKFNSKKIYNHWTVDTKNVSIFSDSSNVATIGVKDLIIVKNKENILVLKKGHSQKVKTLVDNFKI